MPKVELLYAPDCPHAGTAREQVSLALREAGLPAHWRELDLTETGLPEHLRAFGSPTVLIDGVDVAEGVPGQGPSCRVYGTADTYASSLRSAILRALRGSVGMTIALLLALTLSSCAKTESASVALWEPVDSQFEGCAGACGAKVTEPTPGVIAQPGAAPGQRVYCPVSGAVFEVNDAHPHAEVSGKRLYFCCDGCAEYFAQHRAAVLRARGKRVAR